jgi:hypothetical protein
MIIWTEKENLMDRKGKLDALTVVKFALDIAKYVT